MLGRTLAVVLALAQPELRAARGDAFSLAEYLCVFARNKIYDAIENDRVEALPALLADPCAAPWEHGASYLDNAVTGGHTEVAEFLLSLPEIDPNSVDWVGENLAMKAAGLQRVEILSAFLDSPAFDPFPSPEVDRTSWIEGDVLSKALSQYYQEPRIPELVLWHPALTEAAERPPRKKAEFCARNAKQYGAREQIHYSINRMGFANQGGLLDMGTCWWHSRLTRDATMLAVYRPDLPEPTNGEVYRILFALTYGDRVVEIPFYANLAQFTFAREEQVQRFLNAIQLVSGGVGFGWIDGIAAPLEMEPENLESVIEDLLELAKVNTDKIPYLGRPEGEERKWEISPKSLQAIMRGIYLATLRDPDQLPYLKLQQEGVSAHSALVLEAKRVPTGYDFVMIDSNYFAPVRVEYRYGQRLLKVGFGESVPALRMEDQYQRYRKAAKRYCGG